MPRKCARLTYTSTLATGVRYIYLHKLVDIAVLRQDNYTKIYFFAYLVMIFGKSPNATKSETVVNVRVNRKHNCKS